MLSNADFIDLLRNSRSFFLRHLEGLTPEQVEFKPFPECKNVRETVSHLIADDRAALGSLKTGEEPDYEGVQVAEQDYSRLLEMLEASHRELVDYLVDRYGRQPMDAVASIYGDEQPAAKGIAYLTSEDFYHAGQVAFIRMATDPTWDYYQNIYGGGG